LAVRDVNIAWTDSGSKGLSIIAEGGVDLVVADEDLEDMTGLEFIREIVAKYPMVNCAAVSSLTPEAFHEASEGLGIMMQLPVKPSQKHAEILLGHLNKITGTIRT
jgi:CheY-like chemotaxis protein